MRNAGFLTIFSLLLLPRFALVMVALKKPYTLRIAVLLPIGGSIEPLGQMCTKSIELLLATVNNQTAILPQYNVVVDVIDDQCMDNVAVERIMPFFLSSQSSSNDDWIQNSNSYSSDSVYRIPSSFVSLSNSSVQLATYVPPLLIGGMCSAVCKVVTKFAQHFGMINFSGNCNAAELANREVYRNFYRVQSDHQIRDAFINFAKLMSWNKVAIISDSSIQMLQLTSDFIVALNNENMTLLAAEFYDNDPTEAVARVKASGARIIVVNCYFDTCTAVACQGYLNGMHGHHYVWAFPDDTDLTRRKVPEDYCTLEMIKTINENALLFSQLHGSSSGNITTSIGIRGSDFDAYLKANVPEVTLDPAYPARSFCFDNVQPAIFILDNVEKKLSQNGETLKDLIDDRNRRLELTELVRQGTEQLDIQVFTGRIVYEPGAMETLSPTGYRQFQNGEWIVVFEDNGVDSFGTSKPRYDFSSPFLWRTHNGEAPRSEMTVAFARKAVPVWAVSLITSVGVILLMLTIAFLGANLYEWFANERTTNDKFIFVGLILLLGAVVTYPISNRPEHLLTMSKFCKIAPALVVAGYSILIGCLIRKMLEPRSPVRVVPPDARTQRRYFRKARRRLARKMKKTTKLPVIVEASHESARSSVDIRRMSQILEPPQIMLSNIQPTSNTLAPPGSNMVSPVPPSPPPHVEPSKTMASTGSNLVQLTATSPVVPSNTSARLGSNLVPPSPPRISVSFTPAAINPCIITLNKILKERRRNTTRRLYCFLTTFFATNLTLFGLWYGVGGMPTTSTLIFPTYDDMTDTLWRNQWEACSNSQDSSMASTIFPALIIAELGVTLLSTFFVAVSKRSQHARNVKTAVRCVYAVFPSAIASVLTVVIAKRPDVVYYFLSSILLLECSAVIFYLHSDKATKQQPLTGLVKIFRKISSKRRMSLTFYGLMNHRSSVSAQI